MSLSIYRLSSSGTIQQRDRHRQTRRRSKCRAKAPRRAAKAPVANTQMCVTRILAKQTTRLPSHGVVGRDIAVSKTTSSAFKSSLFGPRARSCSSCQRLYTRQRRREWVSRGLTSHSTLFRWGRGGWGVAPQRRQLQRQLIIVTNAHIFFNYITLSRIILVIIIIIIIINRFV